MFLRIAATNKFSVVVLDMSTYQTALGEEGRRPVTSWNKARLIDAIRRWGGPPDNWLLTWANKKSKHQLLDFVRGIHPSPKYNIQKIAEKFTTESFQIKILFLPVAHLELNPIEIVW